MKLLTLLVSLQAVLAVISVLLLVYKYLLLRGYTLTSKRPMRLRWVGFYDGWEMTGTSSELRRGVMQRNNKLSLAFWACLTLIIALVILETRMPDGL